jgi:hypothetical protein
MRSNTKKVRKVLVKAVVVVSLSVIGLAFADPNSPGRPGGGYAEPIVLQPTLLGDGMGGGGNSYPMHMATF